MSPPVSLEPATLPPPCPVPTDLSPISKWLDRFNTIANSPQASDIEELFMKDGYWRDHLCLSWDYITAQGTAKITRLLTNSKTSSIVSLSIKGDPFAAPVDAEGRVNAINAYIDVKTSLGHGRGFLRLLQEDGKWKAFNIFTALYGLDKYPERTGANRPSGVEHGAVKGRKNWKDRRDEERNQDSPVVMIIGAGQGGLMTAARLKMLGIETLVVEKNERVGDNWRKRYDQLVLHDPVHYDHMPYLPFPSNWPTFTPKDKLADWFETYASVLELNILTSANITSALHDTSSGRWKLSVDTPTGSRSLSAKYLILATGHSGEPSMPVFPGMSNFAGDVLCHSSAHVGAKHDLPADHGRKAVVVGCCNSGHDIAQDYFEYGYDVTIVQRSTTYVMTSEHGLRHLFAGTYEENGPPVEDSDIIFFSLPIPVLKKIHVKVTENISKDDARTLDGLRKAGYKLDTGPHDSGFFMKYIERGGGYYLDVGASMLIAAGDIKIKQGQEIKEIVADGIVFEDDSKLEADEIVCATGYDNMVTTAKKILGPALVEGVEDVWGIDGETLEIRGMWRMATPQGLWFMGGNLALIRWFSRMVALGIAAREAGLVKEGEVTVSME